MKKNLFTILILALLVVNIVLTTIMMVNVMGTNKKTAELVTNIATVLNLELTTAGDSGSKSVSLADTTIYSMSGDNNVMIPLKLVEGEKQSYMLFDISFSINKTHENYETYGSGDLSAYKDVIKSVITEVVSQYTQEECQQKRSSITEEILEAVQEYFNSDFIYKVSLSEVKYG